MSLSTIFARLATLICAVCIPLASGAAQVDVPLTKVSYQETIRSLMFVPSYVAFSKGYFRDEGLDVDMKTSQGTDKAMAVSVSDSRAR